MELGAGGSAIIADGRVAGSRLAGLLAKTGTRLEAFDVAIADSPVGLVKMYGAGVIENGLTFEDCERDRVQETIVQAAEWLAHEAETAEPLPDDEPRPSDELGA